MSDFLANAEEHGRLAALAGKTRKSCPYHSGGVMKGAWLRGFTRVEREALAQAKGK